MTQIPTTTRALRMRKGGFARGPVPQTPESLAPHLDIGEAALPPLRSGQVLVEVILAAVNPSDLFYIQGGYGQPRVEGQAGGFEAVGRVIAGEGPQAEALIGQRVAFLGTGSGTWAHHAVSDAALCLPLDDRLRDEDAAGLIVNPLTAVALLEIAAEGGNPAVIVNAAASQLGRLILPLARDRGLAALAVVRNPAQVEELKQLGAAEVLVSSDPRFDQSAREAIRAHAPRVLLDAVADQATADLFFAMPRGARWITYGKMSSESPKLDQMAQLIFLEKRIEGFWLSRWLPKASAERRAAVVREVQDRFISGQWQTRIAARIRLDEVMDQLLPALASGRGKVLIAPR